MQTKIQLEPHVRIQRAGYVVAVGYVKCEDGQYRQQLCLTRDSVPVFCGDPIGRNSGITIAELEQRIRRGLLRKSGEAYSSLLKLADAAEQLAREGV